MGELSPSQKICRQQAKQERLAWIGLLKPLSPTPTPPGDTLPPTRSPIPSQIVSLPGN